MCLKQAKVIRVASTVWPRQAVAFISWRCSVEFSVSSHCCEFRIKSKRNTHRYSDPGSGLLNSHHLGSGQCSIPCVKPALSLPLYLEYHQSIARPDGPAVPWGWMATSSLVFTKAAGAFWFSFLTWRLVGDQYAPGLGWTLGYSEHLFSAPRDLIYSSNQHMRKVVLLIFNRGNCIYMKGFNLISWEKEK